MSNNHPGSSGIPDELLPLKQLAEALRRPLDRPLLDEFVTVDELAVELKRNRRTLDRWEKAGTGPPRTYVGKTVLYNRASVRKWLAKQEHVPPQFPGSPDSKAKSKARETE
jgi:hypothetical protein